MHEAAFDQTSLAFPGLGNCHGIVYMNGTGLFGYHMAGATSAARVTAFGLFVSSHPNGGGPGICLYGLCPTNRYAMNKDSAHKAELKDVADALGFKGKLKGYRWNVQELGWGTTYVEIQYNQGVPGFTIESFTNDGGILGKNADHMNQRTLTYLADPVGEKTAKVTRADDVIVGVKRTGNPMTVNPYTL
jgi:hypothetical protein